MAWRGTRPSAFARTIERDVSRLQLEMTVYALQQLILRSPVDTGAYRGSHFVTVGRRDTQDVPNLSPGEAQRMAEMLLADDSKPFKPVYIQTNIVYGISIENGHSQQAPQGVYAVSYNNLVQRFRQ